MRSIIISIILTILLAPSINADTKELHDLGAKGYALVLDMQFNDAHKIFDEIIKKEPDNALGYFLKALGYEYEIHVSGPEEALEKEFKKTSFKAADLAKEMLKKNKDNNDARFYLGFIYGDLGLYYGATGRYLKALWYGRKATPIIEELLEKDPEYYDAYLGVGLFEYALDYFTKRVKILSILFGDDAGDREKGIEHMKLALEKGSYTRDKGKFLLADWIYFTFEDNDEEALKLFEELAEKYPNNIYIKMRAAKCLMNVNRYDNALETLNKLLEAKNLNKYQGIQYEVYRYLGQAYSDINEYEKSIQTLESGLKLLESQKRTESWEYQWALYYIGNSYEILGQGDKSREYYLKVSKKDKTGAYSQASARLKNPMPPTTIALIKGANYINSKDFEKAGEIFNNLIEAEFKKEPINIAFIAAVKFNIGKLEYDKKEYEKSIKTFREVLASNDMNEPWVKLWSHYYIGDCYKYIGETEKAKQEFDAAGKTEDTRLQSMIANARKGME